MTFAEAQRVMTDPKHPRHRMYKSGDPATVAAVNKAYEDKFGNAEVDPNDHPNSGEIKLK